MKVGVLGPLGSGKTTLIEFIAKSLSPQHEVAIITNDVISNYDAERIYRDLVTSGIIRKENLIGIVTGGCPHTAIREDPSINLRALNNLVKKEKPPDLILLESGGDNVMSTFSPSLADYTVYVLDTAAGDKYPKKGGLGIMESDLLVINKIDLAPFVGADLEKMKKDAYEVRKGKPFIMVSLKTGEGLNSLLQILRDDLGV
ncbi:urease accessory protein UreG [Sulfuracidifex metallicus]|uniref:Urease accessory protein UreG n=1 Tax=Sulfuracidifex metallicus DSM 6482 = JCM 9184 TaxID=523847 RepID=A0A6A9QVH7_SULME|nr:urease accessory protein UreG [Sulfuracidifex metallicus]MUN29062.1 urease accessory protein UreG [Sulfuracidifex metallicus DSM 6482 = JCM 9184]WOE51988.1 urease accessory protein UreG [Sulfuracidifex metallicus DSM 6482 = JCM 9184]